MTSETSAESTRPSWIIKECLKISGGAQGRGEGRWTCERCGSPLYAELWKIEETTTAQIWSVGSTCVKALTGQTLTELRRAESAFLRVVAADAEEREIQGRIVAFVEARAEDLIWLDEHIHRIHAAGEKLLAKGGGIGGSPLPSAEFWEDLRMAALMRGSWTEKQVAVIAREREIDHNAKLADVGQKLEIGGPVVEAVVRQGFRRGQWNVVVEFEAGGRYIATACVGTSFCNELAAALSLSNREDTFGTSQERLAQLLATRLAAGNYSIRVKATVKSHRVIGGKAYLARCQLVSLVTAE